jgi:hypothetical protein
MATRRPIDERDIDGLLASLTDRQIAELFGMSEEEIATLRRERRASQAQSSPEPRQIKGFGGTDENA